MTIDVASVLDQLVPGAQYFGSVTDNTEAAYDALDWFDTRAKPTWAEIVAASGPTPQQQYDTAIAAGLQITSTGSPSISATYALDKVTLDQIRALAVDCGAGLGFPGGGSTFAYPDATGAPKVFTEAQIKAVYSAVRDHLYQLGLALAGQGSWPTDSVTIP